MKYTRLIKTAYQKLLKPILFLFDPEFIHDSFSMTGKLLGKSKVIKRIVRRIFRYDSKLLEQEYFDIKFNNPVGLSAGFDKEVSLVDILPDIGFAHMELGSITWESYKGNKEKRLKRLPKQKSIIVNYGLKNKGAQKTLELIKKSKIDKDFVLGISIAKTNSPKTVDENVGIDDYFKTFELFNKEDIGKYYTINISCPNAFGGEPYTTPNKLEKLLKKLRTIKTDKPVFIKMPINLSWKDFDNLLKVIIKYNIEGVVIGNLNKHRTKELEKLAGKQKGSFSGKLTEDLCNELISKTYKKYGNKLFIVGVGGIFSAEDAIKKIRLGASLVQLITGMIFEGPQLIGAINKGIEKYLIDNKYNNISEIIGTFHKSN